MIVRIINQKYCHDNLCVSEAEVCFCGGREMQGFDFLRSQGDLADTG